MSIALAARWDERVMRAAHPIAYPLLNAQRRPAVRVPGLGVLVRDPALIRATLMNTASFTKTGPGSPSDLWTPVLGAAVLLNMEGADHLALPCPEPLFTFTAEDIVDGHPCRCLDQGIRVKERH